MTRCRVTGYNDSRCVESFYGFKGSGVQGFTGSGVQGFTGSGVQGFKGSGVQGFKVQRFRGSSVHRFKGSGVQRFWAQRLYPHHYALFCKSVVGKTDRFYIPINPEHGIWQLYGKTSIFYEDFEFSMPFRL